MRQGGVYRVLIDEAVVNEITRRLVQVADPQRIILFGSRARGDHRPDSDVDFLMVTSGGRSARDCEVRAYAALGGMAVPADILCYTREEVERWSSARNHVVARALREGRVIYEKRA